MIKYLIIFYLFIIYNFVVVDANRFTFVKEVSLESDSSIISGIYKASYQYYAVDGSKLYNFDLLDIFSSISSGSTVSNQVSSISSTLIPGEVPYSYLKLSKYNGTDVIGYITTQKAVIQIGSTLNSFTTKPFESTSPIIDNLWSTGGENNLAYIGYPYSINIITDGELKTRSLGQTGPLSLSCDFEEEKCFLASKTGFSVLYLGNSWGSTISSSTGSSNPRTGGIVSTRKRRVYYCVDSDDGVRLEAWSYFASQRITHLGSLGVTGTCKFVAFDERMGQLFILTTDTLVGMDTNGKNVNITSFPDAPMIVSMDIVSNSSSDANDQYNYLLMTRQSISSKSLIITKYNSFCPELCNNNGYCSFGACVCKSGNSRCGDSMEILSLSSEVINDIVYVTLQGFFHTPLDSTHLSVYLGSETIQDIVINNSSHVIFKLNKYIKSSSITVDINGLTISFTSDDIYPYPEIDYLYQENQYIIINTSMAFVSWYEQSIVLDESIVDYTISNGTNIKVEPKDNTHSSSYRVIITFNGVMVSYILDMEAYITEQLPTILQKSGDPLILRGLYFGLDPRLLLDGDPLVISSFVSYSQISTQLPSGIYNSLRVDNGSVNKTITLVYSQSPNSSTSYHSLMSPLTTIIFNILILLLSYFLFI